MTKIKEWESYAETAVYQHINDGKTEYETVNEVNKPVKPTIQSKTCNKVGHIRVKMVVEEDDSVEKNGNNYYKSIETIQERDGGKNATSTYHQPMPDETHAPADPHGAPGNPTALGVLKNFVDQIHESINGRLKVHDILLFVLAGLSAAALVVGLIALG